MPPDADPFSLSLSHDGDVAVVAVQGTVDLYTAREVRDLLNEALPQAGGWVVLDLSATTFFDSTGLAALIAAHRRAERMGGRLVVVNVDREIARLLQVTGLDTLLSLTGDRETAIEQLRERAS
jgi:anti-sigma B factor antagonist